VAFSRVNFTFTVTHYMRGRVYLRADMAVVVEVDIRVFTCSV